MPTVFIWIVFFRIYLSLKEKWGSRKAERARIQAFFRLCD
jgi:hypothetical protein